MGEFVHATALPAMDPDLIARAIVRFAAGYDVAAEVTTAGATVGRDAAIIVPPKDGWVVVDWPRFATYADRAGGRLSAEFGVVASSIDIYDSDLWCHIAYDAGCPVDHFASDPREVVADPAQLPEAKRRWQGDADVLGDLFNRPPATIAPYFVNPYTFTFRLFRRFLAPHDGKAFPDDHSLLEDTWVVTDFWRRLGIPYPDAPAEDWPSYPAVVFSGTFPPEASHD
ncbi:hypothetical protein [Winogradskya humida]|uniref:Uncharacterized protein n=1 Tax=Winogradskya humida TaxID=113566 RepID=A0ABQ3ZEW8_9ACTN|nr:hypothetical protein [Actinoplanes humidus]GIE17120.1 hypothetical protein Ahu01nite_002220 [Actinoplanes humidus]